MQYILTSVMDALAANPERKFVVVEQWFFSRWWRAQEVEVQTQVRALVASGQLVFANGGLVMHDEASPTYIGEYMELIALEEILYLCPHCAEVPSYQPTPL